MLKLIQRITYLTIIGSVVTLCITFITGFCLGPLSQNKPSIETVDLLMSSFIVSAFTFLGGSLALCIENFTEVEMKYRHQSKITNH